jgi:hypothetical protein
MQIIDWQESINYQKSNHDKANELIKDYIKNNPEEAKRTHEIIKSGLYRPEAIKKATSMNINNSKGMELD